MRSTQVERIGAGTKTDLDDLEQIGPLKVPSHADAHGLVLALPLVDRADDVRRLAGLRTPRNAIFSIWELGCGL